MASKAVAAAQGPLHAMRGTGEAEKMLKNARTEYHNEFEEIGFYAGIESLADTVGDKETAKLARGIRREEERMAKFLEKQIQQLAKAVAREEIPAAERRNGGSRSQLERARRRALAQLLERLRPLVERVAQPSSRAKSSRSSSASSRTRRARVVEPRELGSSGQVARPAPRRRARSSSSRREALGAAPASASRSGSSSRARSK